MQEEKVQVPHSVILENGQHLVVSGVDEVLSFDEEAVSLETVLGRLEIRGNNMHILSFETAGGDVVIDGKIYAVVYTKSTKPQSFIKRVFR